MERELRDQLLRLLENNSRLSTQNLAVMLGVTEKEVTDEKDKRISSGSDVVSDVGGL